MCTLMKRNRILFLLFSVFFLFGNITVFAQKAGTGLAKQEDGYYYGSGKGATLAEAELAAKRELVENALTAALRAVNPKAPRVTVSDESVKARLVDLKPHSQSKKKEPPAMTYRIKTADWDKREKAYTDALRSDLTTRFNAARTERNPAKKMQAAFDILLSLIAEGEVNLLSALPGGNELFSDKVEAFCSEVNKGLVFTLSVPDGFTDSATEFSVKVSDASGNAAAGLSLAAVWEIPSIPTDAEAVDVPEVRSLVETDALGNAVIEYPVSENYRNRPVSLTLTTVFEKVVPSSAVLKKLDAQNSIEGRYVRFDDVSAAFPSVSVSAGEFNAGAVAQDTRAGRKEAARTAGTGAYAIDLTPVTNARYAAFLYITRAENFPEYFDNPDYNDGKQPVVGISKSDAEAYAAWLSEQTGFVYRLPTDDEWEKAARAGNETIYPWGDENPADQQRANYKGNGVFAGLSPVGSFENGKNAWGLADMAGNVWEWTSSARGVDGESTLCTVKGGSWMDGPVELRISNFRNIDGQNGYADVGFRLVKEVSE